jgi:hypothetical protein
VDIEQTKQLIAKAAIIDNRTADLATITAWHELIGHLDARDAFAALNLHRQRSDQWLQPKHIVDLAKEAKRDRERAEAKARALRALPPAPPKPMPDWFREARQKLREALKTPTPAPGAHPGPDSGS